MVLTSFNLKSYPIKYNEKYEDPLERPRMTKYDIFKSKNKSFFFEKRAECKSLN